MAGETPVRIESMGGLAKGLRIIELIGMDRSRLTLSEAAEATGITPASARRCLLTLASLGYLTHDGKFFRPTPRLARLGTGYDSVSPLSVLAQPCLDAVRDELGDACSLAVLDGDEMLFIARAEATRIVSLGGRIGRRLPVVGSATGRVMLASMPDGELEQRLREAPPEALTENALVAVDDIRARVMLARAEDAAITAEELELGVNTMAVPVRDVGGRVHATMSLAVLASRVSAETMRDEFLPVLRREATRLGEML